MNKMQTPLLGQENPELAADQIGVTTVLPGAVATSLIATSFMAGLRFNPTSGAF